MGEDQQDINDPNAPERTDNQTTVTDGNEEEEVKKYDTPDEDGGIDPENPEEDDPVERSNDVPYPYLIIHAQARPGPYQPDLDAHIHNRGGVDADEWIRYSMMDNGPIPAARGGKRKKKEI